MASLRTVLAIFVPMAALIAAPPAYARQNAERDSVSLAPAYSTDPAALAELESEIADADASQIFAVQLVFEEPPTVEDLHIASLRLKIPRILAFVDRPSSVAGRPPETVIVGLGAMYSSEVASRHTRCRALISVNYGPDNPLRNQSVDEWPVSKIHVYAAAHAVRQLLDGSLSPPAHVIDGSAAEADHVRKLAEYTHNEVRQKIELPANVSVPEPCRQQVAPIEAPILVSDYDPLLNQLPQREGDDFRDYAFRTLASLSADSAVTIRLKLNFQATIDDLSAIVWQHGIDGMSAELVPANSSIRAIALAALSVHGAPLPDQVRRARCQMRLPKGPEPTGEWFADWVVVSMPLAKAWAFLSYPRFAQATVVGKFPQSDLERLKTYHERESMRVHEMPANFDIPSGCEDVYQRR